MAAAWRYLRLFLWSVGVLIVTADSASPLAPTTRGWTEDLHCRVSSPCSCIIAGSVPQPANTWRYGRYVVAATAGAAIFTFDKDLNDFSHAKYFHSSGGDAFFRQVPNLGTRGPYAVSIPLLVGYGLIFKERKYVVAGGELAAGLVLVEAVTQGAKGAFGRKRPFESASPYHFFEGGTSFFSGHSSSVMTFATILSKNFPRQDLSVIGIDRRVPVVPILAYSVAAAVMAHRLYTNVHWSSDVYTGAMVGYGVGTLMVHLGRKFSRTSVSVIVGDIPRVSMTIRF